MLAWLAEQWSNCLLFFFIACLPYQYYKASTHGTMCPDANALHSETVALKQKHLLHHSPKNCSVALCNEILTANIF